MLANSLFFATLILVHTCTTNALLSELGADVSSLPRFENRTYYDADGKQTDVLDILKGKGVNYIRIRIWHNPTNNSCCGHEEVLALAKKVHSKGK